MKRDARRIARLEARIASDEETGGPKRGFKRIEIIYVTPPGRERLRERGERPGDGDPWHR